ncbi:dehydrodolichyl diphosphate synthase complex subunit nus1 [Synchiropus splendidus]|uniref:dehydrodolichyl diphosphate synthase complex subunit nus1 n=1 Tax=Synchiropus splendidus TaxID=270530 RepID=UPI00237E6CBA|nr:dehydrodolichyl diphosphate synthase complex subunit nus1 [Synchiropus splendidus]
MALLSNLLWQFLLVVVHLNRAVVSWLRGRIKSVKGRLRERVTAALLLPLPLVGFMDYGKKYQQTLEANGTPVRGNRYTTGRPQCLSDGRSLEKLPAHIGLLVAEEQPSYTDIANLVVWCIAVGISYVSIYDNYGIFQKNKAQLLEVILQQQQELLGPGEASKNKVEFISSNADKNRHHVLSCGPTVKVLAPEDGKQSIVEAAQQLCRSVETKERSFRDISVTLLDVLLRESKDLPDPELVVKFGPVDSTLGFLPWHIRLTEFISLPSHRDVAYEDLLGVLKRYARCQQRLGQ